MVLFIFFKWLPGEWIITHSQCFESCLRPKSPTACVFPAETSAEKEPGSFARRTGAWSLPCTSGSRAMRGEHRACFSHCCHCHSRCRYRRSRTPHFYHCCRASAATIQPCPCHKETLTGLCYNHSLTISLCLSSPSSFGS